MVHLLNQTGARRRSFGPHVPVGEGRLVIRDATGDDRATALVARRELRARRDGGCACHRPSRHRPVRGGPHHRLAKVRPGNTIVVLGANGGVGSTLVQLARHANITVIGTASARHHETVRELGATAVDYRDPDIVPVGRG